MACQQVLKWVWPSMNPTEHFALHSNSNTTRGHAPQVEWKYWYCMQTNQLKIIGDKLSVKSPMDSKENSTVYLTLFWCCEFMEKDVWWWTVKCVVEMLSILNTVSCCSCLWRDWSRAMWRTEAWRGTNSHGCEQHISDSMFVNIHTSIKKLATLKLHWRNYFTRCRVEGEG